MSDKPPAFEDLELVPLKTAKVDDSKILGTLSAEFHHRDELLVLQEETTSFGDCATCSRGFSLSNLISIRLEGKNLGSLKVYRTVSPHVKIISCPKGRLLPKVFVCRFEMNKEIYGIKLILL